MTSGSPRKLLWWCFRRKTDASIQVRRYYGRGEIRAARGRRTVSDPRGPYEAAGLEQAMQIARALIIPSQEREK